MNKEVCCEDCCVCDKKHDLFTCEKNCWEMYVNIVIKVIKNIEIKLMKLINQDIKIVLIKKDLCNILKTHIA